MTAAVGRRVAVWFAVVVLGAVTVRVALTAPEQCGDPTPDSLRASAAEAVDWFARNQRDDGTWLYLYDAEAGRDLGDYNWVRHAGVMLSLAQAANAGFPGAAEVAARGRETILERLRTHDDRTAFENGGVLTTGGTALLTVALAERRLGTGDTSDDELLRGLGRFLANQVERGGAVREAADRRTGEPIPGGYSPFSTGEAMFALARLERLFPGEDWAEPVSRIGRYLAYERADAEGYVPDVSDHWAAYAFAEMTEWSDGTHGLAPHELAFVRKQMGIGAVEVRYESQRTNEGLNRVLRGHSASGSGTGTVGEALGGFARVAAAEPTLAGQGRAVTESLACVAGLLQERQVSAAEAAAFPDPDATRGAFLQDGVTRMDDQQHTLSAFLTAAARLEAVDMLPRREPVPGPAELAVLAALCAGNPLRIAARGPRGRGTTGTVALGSAAGVVVLGTVAAVGGPLTDALDVSAGSALVAAGLGVALAGLLGLATRSLAPEPALEGRRAALVPVLVPLFARPELLLLAVALGAGGRGWALVAGAAGCGILAAVATGAVTAVDGGGPAAVIVRWGVRLTAAAALGLGVALVVEGVYAA